MAKYDDRFNVVTQVDNRYPELLGAARSTGSEALRGAFVDQVAHTLNKLDGTNLWGRKARVKGDASSLNDDVLTYDLGSGEFRMIDIVVGDQFLPGWDLRPADEQNGFWHPPLNPDLDYLDRTPAPPPTPTPTPTPVPPPDLFLLLSKLEDVEQVGKQVAFMLQQVSEQLDNMPTYEGRIFGIRVKMEPKYSD